MIGDVSFTPRKGQRASLKGFPNCNLGGSPRLFAHVPLEARYVTCDLSLPEEYLMKAIVLAWERTNEMLSDKPYFGLDRI